MKFQLAATFGLLLATSIVHAQKDDRERFYLQNTHLPSKIVYDQIKSYNYTATTISSGLYTYDYATANNIGPKLISYDRTELNPDLKVEVQFGPYIEIEEKTNVRTTEEEVNKVKTKVTYYSRKVYFRFPITYKVINSKNAAVIYENVNPNSNALALETGESKSEAEVTDYMSKNKARMVREYLDRFSLDFMTRSNSILLDQIDFFPNAAVMDIYKVKKWDKDDEYNAHVENVIKAFKVQTADEPTSSVRSKIESDITYFTAFDGQFNPKDKRQDVLFFINNYNLALIHFSLDEMAKAKYYTNKLDSVKENERATNVLKSYIGSAEARMAKHFLTTTHLNYNPVKDFRLAGKDFISDASSSQENLAAAITSGKTEANDLVVFSDGKETKGKVIHLKEKGEIQFFSKESPEKPIILTPTTCNSFVFEGKQYETLKNSSGGAPVKQFFIVHFSSPKIKLVQYVDGTMVPNATYIGFIRPKEDVVTFYASFSMKKKLASYFEDCPAVSEKAKEGDMGTATSLKKVEVLIEFMKQYTDCK